MCDHKENFLDICVGFPGSVHDARILKNSAIYSKQLYLPEGRCILGDGGYPCLTSPITITLPWACYLSSWGPLQQASFQCQVWDWEGLRNAEDPLEVHLFKSLEVSPDFIPIVVTCCAILHNMCFATNDIIDVDDNDGDDDDDVNKDNVEAREVVCGDVMRNRLAAAVSAPNIHVPALMEHDYV